jgi:hypothetical protein
MYVCGLQMRVAYSGLIYRKVNIIEYQMKKDLKKVFFKDSSIIKSFNEHS